MAKQRGETYCAVTPGRDTSPPCVVTGCSAPVVAEVHTDSYADALEMFRGIRREKVRSRRPGDERLFVCLEHLEHDKRMAALGWQWLLF
jgi:hypothetical protein